ncbi:2OG-Fe(II) oxygenase [Sulfurimonas sp.]
MKKLYEKITDALVDDGYIVIENALPLKLSQKLSQQAKDTQTYKQAGISNAQAQHLDTNRRRDSISWLNRDGEAEQEYLSFADALQKYLNRSLYLGLSYYEAHFAYYKRGDFYEKHYDSFKNSKNRVVTTVYYLNEEWSQSDGGALVIYDENNRLIQKVLPQQNTLVVFLSEKFPHEVLRANKERYSIAGWFRVDKVQ